MIICIILFSVCLLLYLWVFMRFQIQENKPQKLGIMCTCCQQYNLVGKTQFYV